MDTLDLLEQVNKIGKQKELWREMDNRVVEYFCYYAQQKELLSRMKIELIEERGEELNLLRYCAKLEKDEVDIENRELRILVSKLVDDLEELILNYVLDIVEVEDASIVTDELMEEYKTCLIFDRPFRPNWFKEGLEEVHYLGKIPNGFQGSIFLSEGYIGSIGFYIGESLTGKPEIWLRRHGVMIQIGVGVKIESITEVKVVK